MAAMAMRRLCCCFPFLEEKDGEEGGEKVDGIPGQCVEAPSSSTVIKKILNEDIPADDLDKLVKHISELLRLREQVDQKKPLHKKSKSWTWPSGSDWKELNEILSSGLEFISDLKDIISGPVKTILKGIGNASLATAGLLVVAYTLERFDDISTNNEQCFELLKEMSNVAKLVKILKENPKEMENEIEDATAMIVKGAIMCCAQMNSSPWKRFLEASKKKEDLSDITQQLLSLYSKIGAHGGLRAANDIGCVLTVTERTAIATERVLTAIEHWQKMNLKDELERLQSRALVTKTTNGMEHRSVRPQMGEDELERLQSRALVHDVASVHDVILTLPFEMSMKESQGKEVRRTLRSALSLKDFLQDPEITNIFNLDEKSYACLFTV